MSDARFISWVGITGLFVTLMSLYQGAGVDWWQMALHFQRIAIVVCAAYLCRRSRVGLFVKTVALWMAFVLVFILAERVVATTARPLADPLLATLDCGIALQVFGWIKEHPYLDGLLTAIYQSAFAQNIVAVCYLSATAQRERLDALLIRFALTALISLVGFYWLPALGTVACGLPISPDYQLIITELARLRTGFAVISGSECPALITFPSFHTVSAVLLISVYHRTILFKPMLVLNSLMILSTMTAGMHYAIDVLGGLAVCAVVIPATRIATITTPATLSGQI